MNLCLCSQSQFCLRAKLSANGLQSSSPMHLDPTFPAHGFVLKCFLFLLSCLLLLSSHFPEGGRGDHAGRLMMTGLEAMQVWKTECHTDFLLIVCWLSREFLLYWIILIRTSYERSIHQNFSDVFTSMKNFVASKKILWAYNFPFPFYRNENDGLCQLEYISALIPLKESISAWFYLESGYANYLKFARIWLNRNILTFSLKGLNVSVQFR